MANTRTKLTGLVLVAALAVMPGLASAWRALNWHEVYPVDKNVFEVIGRAGSGPAQYWCGAGDYARVVMGVAPTQTIFMWRAVGPSVTRPGHRAVQFSLTAAPGTEDFVPGYSLTMRQAGDRMNAALAQQYCRDLKLPWF